MLWQTVTVAEIATDKIIYRVSVVHRLDLAPGSNVKFALSGRRGWLIDDRGVERKLSVRSASVLPRP